MNIKYFLLPIALLSTYTQAETKHQIDIVLVQLNLKPADGIFTKEINPDFERFKELYNDSTTKRSANQLISLGQPDLKKLIRWIDSRTCSKLITQSTAINVPGCSARITTKIYDKDKTNIEWIQFDITATRNESGEIHIELSGALNHKLETTELKGSANMQSNETVMLDKIHFNGQDHVFFIRVQDAN